MFVWLEMQIGCPHVESIQEHLVQKLDDRRVFDFGDACVRFFGRILYRYIVKLKVASAADQRIHRFTGGFCRCINEPAQLVILGNNPIHPHLGREFDFFSRLLVRRIRRCDNKAVIALAQDNNTIGLAYLVIQQFFR
ncbi:hypothetical protein D3C71_1433990 [compost metagenome]